MKNYLVIGGSGGIGSAICTKLLSNNQQKRVIATYNTNPIPTTREDFHVEKCDITNSEDTANTIQNIHRKFGAMDRVVVNSGITRDKLFITMKEGDFLDVINVNLLGTFRVLKEIVYPMLKNKGGRIVLISSVVGFTGNYGQANYSASKSAMLGLCRSIVKELASKNIAINIVAPGFIKTAMTDKVPEKVKDQVLDHIPSKRFGTASEVAELVNFLLTSESNYINGSVIPIDGGLSMGI